MHDSSQPGMGQAFGAGVIIEWEGQKYQVDSFGLEDWGRIENELVLRKRNDIMRLINAQYGQLPRDVWDEKYDQARREANAIASVEQDEINDFLNTPNGVCLFFWVLLDRRYPGRFQYDAMLKVAYQFVGQEEKMTALINSMNMAAGLGGGPANPQTAASQSAA